MFTRYARHVENTWKLAEDWPHDGYATGDTMQDRLIETEVLVPEPKRFVREALVMPDGFECDWYYVDTPLSVMVVPDQLEFPAGTMHETEDPEAAARRELEEETGFTPAAPGPMCSLGSFY